jgi:hypothetical protein
MAFPTTKVEISFTATTYERNPATWVDVTDYTRNISIRRGRNTDLEQFPTSTASITLDNRDRRFDPFNTAGPYYGELTPRRQIRITADTGSGYVPVWRGWISGWPIEYTNAGFDVTTTIECFDILGLIAEEQTLSDAPAYFGYFQPIVDRDYYRYRLNEPAGETVLLSELISATARRTMTQVAGPFSYTTFDPLAPGFPYSSIRIGRGNTWQAAARQIPTFQFTQGGDFAFWMANEAPGVQLQAVRLSANNDYYVTILASGAIQVDQYNGVTRTTVISSTTPFANFAPHHVQISSGLTDESGLFGQPNEIYVDGENVSGARSTAAAGYPAPPLGYGAFQLSNHIFQDFMFYGRSLSGVLGGRTPQQAAALAREIYGSAVNNAPETSRAKAIRVLDRSAIVNAWRSLDTNPESTLGTQGGGLALFNELQNISQSEGGELFATKDGQLRLTNRSTAAANGAGTASATFADDGTGIPYGPRLGININADELVNRLNVVFAGGGEITQSIADSITAYGVRESTSETYLATKQDALDFAAHEVGTFAQPIPQFTALEVSTTQNLAQWATILNLELLDKITLTLTPKAGAAITQPLIVNSITHDITPGQWVSTVQGSARYIGWFIINRSLIGGPDLLV